MFVNLLTRADPHRCYLENHLLSLIQLVYDGQRATARPAAGQDKIHKI